MMRIDLSLVADNKMTMARVIRMKRVTVNTNDGVSPRRSSPLAYGEN